MSLFRGFDGSEPVQPSVGGLAGELELRRTHGSILAVGTLACPSCDAPVAPPGPSLSPAAPLGCPYCDHAAPARDFLTLGSPSRPAHVQVRVVHRVRPRARRI